MNEVAAPTHKRIESLKVRKLFGAHDYDIRHRQEGNPLEDVVILYGDNGSGKTTILKLVFHLMSASNTRGHRSEVAKIPFKSVELRLTDGTLIRAYRMESLVGSYHLEVASPNTRPILGRFDAEEPSLPDQLKPKTFVKPFIDALAATGLQMYLLSDDRRMLSDAIGIESESAAVRRQLLLQRRMHEMGMDAQEMVKSSAIVDTLMLTHNWIRSQAIRGTNEGSESVNSIYLKLLKRLTIAKPARARSEKLDKIAERLDHIGRRNSQFASLGFSPSLEIDELQLQLRNAPPKQHATVATILEPYVSGLEARLDGLDAIHKVTQALVDNINDFFSNKRMLFDLARGFSFTSTITRSEISPEWLSSGERHLITLFCYALLSREQPSVFLIDEPELSLNIKWQRKLVKTLATLTQGSSNQFILATHSMEILALHRNSVVALDSGKKVNA